MPSRILTAPPDTGTALLGVVLPRLLYDSLAAHPNPHLFNQPTPGSGYVAMSTETFARRAEDFAAGLLDLGLAAGERVCFFLESDVDFAIADMGCLIAGLIDVPVYRTTAPDGVRFILDHASAAALVVTDAASFDEIRGVGGDTVRHVIAMQGPAPAHETLPMHTAASLEAMGAETLGDDAARRARIEALVGAIQPSDVATILYTSGTTGTPKGVVLTHENISYNGMTSLSGLPEYRRGVGGEVALSFLPMTHIFARSNHYGAIGYGTSTYFCDPSEISARLLEVRPTVFLAVPRVLEKVYARIQQRTATTTGVARWLGEWALRVARAFDVDTTAPGAHPFPAWIADRLVFSKWRAALGGRTRYVIVGGAALSAELTNVFSAIGLHVLQGFGLTETSPVITYNRPGRNHAGTVGEPMTGVEVRLASDGEVLTRGPHVMREYYRNPEATAESILDGGWFCTGDIGEIGVDGFLRITDRKKDLFKLSTGKYVMPQPIEQRLMASPLVEHAVVVGSGQKYAAALLFPDVAALRLVAADAGTTGAAEMDAAALVALPVVAERVAGLIAGANAGMESWSTVKRARMVPAHLSLDENTLTPKLSVRRHVVRTRFADEIASMYEGEDVGGELAAALKARRAQLAGQAAVA